MRFHAATPLALLLALAACGPSEEGADQETAVAEPIDAPPCFLDRGTHAEAAERPSPLDSASIRLRGAEVKVCYGAPSARGRTVMGELVPWGEPWRAGANEATGLHVAAPVTVGGVELEPGSYALYAIPSEDRWEIVVQDAFERWGIPIDRAADRGSVEATPEETGEMVERLRWTLEPAGEDEARLVLEWEQTRVSVPVVRADG